MKVFVLPVYACLLLAATSFVSFAQAPVRQGRSGHGRQLQSCRDRHVLRHVREGRRVWQIPPFTAICRSKTPACGPIAIRFIRRQCLTSMPGPSRSRCQIAGKRFMSMIVVNEDHYIYEVDYGAGNYNFTKPEIGTRYVFMALRTLIDPADPKDVQAGPCLAGCSQGAADAAPANSKLPTGIRSARKKCARRF